MHLYPLQSCLLGILRRIRRESVTLRSILCQVNLKPLLILGNQKAGTTAIAALLAKAANLSATLDLNWERAMLSYKQLQSGTISFETFVRINKLDFSRDIVKEPSLTMFYSDLTMLFPKSKYLFVIRDPRDNIRSILNRVKVAGNLRCLRPADRTLVPDSWEHVLDGSWMGLKSRDYIKMLAVRWNVFTDVYLDNQDDMVLIRYEDFLQDKVGAIVKTARALQLSDGSDITPYIDNAFQPPGNASVTWEKFFGTENLARINDICRNRMSRLNYPVI